MITRMLGFFVCAEAGGGAASPQATKNVATTTANLSLRINVLLLLFTFSFFLLGSRNNDLCSFLAEP
jgi:hypothetical protein